MATLDMGIFEDFMIEQKVIQEKIKFAEGIIRVHRIPQEWTDADYAYWWLPQTDGHGKILRPARMSQQEKERYQEAEGRNQIMVAGRTAVLSYIGSSTGSTTQWAQYLAIGTGAISGVNPTDASLANEVFRKAPVTYSVNGNLVDINFALGSSEAVVTMTNVGLFGSGASSTLGSGTMMTKAVFAYTKGSYGINIDYLANLL